MAQWISAPFIRFRVLILQKLLVELGSILCHVRELCSVTSVVGDPPNILKREKML